MKTYKKPLTADQRRKFLQPLDEVGIYQTVNPQPGDFLIFIPALNDRVLQSRSYTTPNVIDNYRPILYVVIAKSDRLTSLKNTRDDAPFPGIVSEWVYLFDTEENNVFHAKMFNGTLNGYVRFNECGSLDD
jgi:hypothetical protein